MGDLHAAWELGIGTHCDGTTGQRRGKFMTETAGAVFVSLCLFFSLSRFDIVIYFSLLRWRLGDVG
jgi:hypothetical protein